MLKLEAIDFSYGASPLLEQVSLQVEAGEICAILGPSGCGKSTLLKLVAGLITPQRGDITWQGHSILAVPTHERGFAMMMQGAKLFPHRNVAENVAFPLQQKLSLWERFSPAVKAQITRRVDELLELVQMREYRAHNSLELSGGQAQRVALARSLAADPQLLLLDEPLSALDRSLRETLLPLLRAIFKKLKLSVIYVTHDQDEAFALADQIVVMDKGRILAAKSPEALWQNPETYRAASFIGYSLFLNQDQARRCGVEIPAGKLLGLSEHSLQLAAPQADKIRASGSENRPEATSKAFPALVKESCLIRGRRQVRLEIAGKEIKAFLPQSPKPKASGLEEKPPVLPEKLDPGQELLVQINLKECVQVSPK